ncbi:ATPase [Stutzerimonas stutzeri]|uniref:ATPase n=1 Tax=Stutzerimonas stutzeri TaxID=316 RepID=UPI00210DBC46|nr:ATPase [Stutzerimonas stutzeri]MCQ4318850.1 ATPase [Stutzerimonas stutzeri]
MQVETLGDVLDWTKAAHTSIADCLAHCSQASRQERVRMLLDYLALHERELSRALTLSKQDASPSALHTWCYEYFKKYPIEPHEQCNEDFRDMDTDLVMAKVLAFHEKVMGLYRYLLSRAEVTSSRELLENLLSLEEHEAMRMARDVGRMQDM